MARDNGDLHIVMFPWSAFGHLLPYYHLSISLAKKGVLVSYISTPKNIERLPKIPSELSSVFNYVVLPFPTVPDVTLPQGAEATSDLESDKIAYLKAAYDLLYDPIKKFVTSRSPDWIISDIMGHWVPELAKECQVKMMFFSVFMPSFLCFVGPSEYLREEGQKRVRPTPDSLTIPPPWSGGILPPSFVLRSFEAKTFHPGVYNKNASGISDAERVAKVFEGCDAIAVRSCDEFEGAYIDLYQKLSNKPVIAVGLLPPAKVSEGETADEKWSNVFKWLDQQNPGSVIYLGFGSEYKLTKEEVYEIAYGLELAQLPFIWALRKPLWAIDDSKALPPGFVDRTSGKGIVCLGWTPQLRVLAHPSVGGALIHCGWSSIIEILQHGHIPILLPCMVDQWINARSMVEKGLGIEVDRRKDGSFTRDDIAIALRTSMVGDEAQKIKTRAKQAAVIFGDQQLHDEHYVNTFVQFLKHRARDATTTTTTISKS